ncbi:MAG: hypothetical protein ACTS73_05320 [Arsenophonus sp. NEOnobi-MAG3]
MMIWDEKSTLQVFTKQDITYNPVHELIRNSYLPQQTIQTGIDDIKIKLPKVRRIVAPIEYALMARCYRLI